VVAVEEEEEEDVEKKKQGVSGLVTEKPLLFALPTSHFDVDGGEVTSLHEDSFLRVGSHQKPSELHIVNFYLASCSTCMERVPMWRAIGLLFKDVEGVHIDAVNCNEVDKDGISKACGTSCAECYPGYPIQNIQTFPTVRSFHMGVTSEAPWAETLGMDPATTVHMVEWILRAHKGHFVNEATANGIRKAAAEMVVNTRAMFEDDGHEDEIEGEVDRDAVNSGSDSSEPGDGSTSSEDEQGQGRQAAVNGGRYAYDEL
jgi:hypothetical protein